MKKTLTINLNGTIFNIEEDGYAKLKDYLDSIREYFSSYDDKEEIMSDIEARAAEKFSEKVSSAKQVITIADVEALMESMGTVEDIAGVERSSKEEPAPKSGSWREKKLYRDPDNAMIMGVAAGIANYFGIDPVLVRLAFIASLFFGGAGILIYIILCFIVPEAKTTAQKMEMQGQPVNLTSLKDAAEEKISAAKVNISTSKPLRKLAITLGSLIRRLAKIFSALVGFGVIFGAIAALIAIFFATGNLVFNANSPYIEFPIREFLPGTHYYLAVLAGFLAASVPAIFAIIVGVSLIKRRLVLNLAAGLLLLMLWIISLTTIGVYAIRIAPQFQERERAEETAEKIVQNYDFRDFDSISASGNYKINVVRGDDFNISATGSSRDLAAAKVALDDGVLRITEDRREKICIFCFDSTRQKTLTITMPAISKFKMDGIVRSTVSGFDQEKIDFDLDGTSRAEADVRAATFALKLDGVSKMTLRGSVDNLTADLNGVSSLEADEVEIKNVTIKSDGTSKADIWATEKLDVRASGVSKISYKGDPQVTQRVERPAKLQKVD